MATSIIRFKIISNIIATIDSIPIIATATGFLSESSEISSVSSYGVTNGVSSAGSGPKNCNGPTSCARIVGFGVSVICGVTLGLIVFVIWASNVRISFIRKKSTQKRITILTNDDIVNLSGKEFNIEKFKKQVFNIYKELQIAWMNFDYGKIKELVSDEMYNMYTNQLETLKIKNQQNIMSDIELINCEITEYCKLNNKEIFKVYMSVNCYDYIINIKNNKVLRGKKHKKLTLGYILTFERNIEIVNHCPQCGSDVKNLTECKYCKSKIVNNNDKLKMTKKQIVSQK